MHATEEHHPSANTAALQALSDRLAAGLLAKITRGGEALAVVATDAPVLNIVAVVVGRTYAAEIGSAETIAIGDVSDPGEAAERVNRMLATVPTAP